MAEPLKASVSKVWGLPTLLNLLKGIITGIDDGVIDEVLGAVITETMGNIPSTRGYQNYKYDELGLGKEFLEETSEYNQKQMELAEERRSNSEQLYQERQVQRQREFENISKLRSDNRYHGAMVSLQNIGLQNLTKINNKVNNSYVQFDTAPKDEPLIKKKQRDIIERENQEQIKMQNRANLFYGDDYDEAKEYFENKTKAKESLKNKREQELLQGSQYAQNTVSPIANVDKTLYPNGNISEMDFETSKKVGGNLRNEENNRKLEISDYVLLAMLQNGRKLPFLSPIGVADITLEMLFNKEERSIVENLLKTKNNKNIVDLNYNTSEINKYLEKKYTVNENYVLKTLLLWGNTISKLDEFYSRPEINLKNSDDNAYAIKNSMRHIVGLARATKIFGPIEAEKIGNKKENYDKNRDRNFTKSAAEKEKSIKDTQIDLLNNQIGIHYIKEHPNATDEEIMYFAYEYSIKNVNR